MIALKKRRLIWVVCALLILCIAGFGICAQRYYLQSVKDAQENAYVLNASITTDDGSQLSGDSIRFSVDNRSYTPVEFREILIVSAYDASGMPMLMDGTSYTDSSVSLVAADGQPIRKMLSAHQAVYASEYSLEKGKPSGKELFDHSWSSESTHEASYMLQTVSGSGYEDCILRLDVILMGRPVDYPYADWEQLDVHTEILQDGGAAEAAADIAAKPLQLPNPQNTHAYTWELYGEKALLVNAQDLQVPHLVVPAVISLSQTENGCVEDPIFGDLYEVMVASNAFFEQSSLQTVTFADNVAVERNAMCATNGQGMFQNCTALVAVENLPDTVVSMKNAFSGCAALEITPQIPESVEDMTQCFWRCAGLKEVSSLPKSILSLDSCFRECTSLEKVPQLPDGVENLTRCFYKCASLRDVGSIPDTVTDMTGCFSFCTLVTEMKAFPAALEKLNFCFQGCTGLSNVAAIPEGVQDLTGCFYNCASLTQIPQLPDSVSNMDSAFYGCTGITQIERWPASLKNLNGCFTGCTNLQTVPIIPRSVMEPAFFHHRLKEAFMGCTSLDDVQIETCSNFVAAEEISDHAEVSFTLQHTRSGVCESCQIANGSFQADDLTIQVTNLESFMLDAIIAFLENDVPECMMDCCSSMTFTSDFEQFGYPLSKAGGIAWYPSGAVHIRVEDYGFVIAGWRLKNGEELIGASREMVDLLKGVIYHELAHCYDTNFSLHYRFSGSSEWSDLVEQEGALFISQLERSDLYTPADYPEECFAKAVSQYFRCPEELKTNSPGMYEYVDHLLKDEAC